MFVRCSYAVRALFVRCSYEFASLFVRCSYERELTRELRDAPVCPSRTFPVLKHRSGPAFLGESTYLEKL